MFCKNCGKELDNSVKFCDGCGNPIEQQANEQSNEGQQNNVNEQPVVNQQNTTNTPPPITNTPPPVYQQYNATTPPPYQQNNSSTSAEDSNNKIIFILSYFGILFFLPLVVCPNSAVGKFHANQGLLLFATGIIGSIVLSIIMAIIPFLFFLQGLFSLAILALAIYGMVNAYNDKQIPLPVIGTLFVLIK